MLAKVCPSCGRVHGPGEACPVREEMRKLYDKKQNQEHREIREFRNGRWKKIRQYIVQRDGGCLVCMDEGCAQKHDKMEVHHIVPLQFNFDLADDETNLIYLCRDDHERAEGGELSRKYLRALVDKSIKTFYGGGN